MAAKSPPVHKIVVVGSGGVGKSALTLRFMYDEFIEEYVPTRLAHYCKNLKLADSDFYIDISDTAGEEDITNVCKEYYQKGEGFMIVFALNNNDSFQIAKEIYEDLQLAKDCNSSEGKENPLDIVLVGNKVDLEVNSVVENQISALANQWKCEYFATSAKNNILVDEAFQCLIDKVNKRKIQAGLPQVVVKKKKKKWLKKCIIL